MNDAPSDNLAFDEDALLPISALQHFRFCNRRVALVHIEGLWAENQFTAEGNVLHRKAHDATRGESRPGLRIVRGMMLRSLRLGLFGKADVVEFSLDGATMRSATIVEYKRGAPKPAFDREFKVQLCAQAICLEESLPEVPVTAAIYYGKTRRRVPVELDPSLREETARDAALLHALIASRVTPPAVYERRKCDRCSMKPLCMPTALRTRVPASTYVERVIAHDAGTDLPNGLWE